MDDDIVRGFCLFYPDILSADTIRTDEDVNFFTDFREVECLGDGSIACTDDCDCESLIEVAITRCTV